MTRTILMSAVSLALAAPALAQTSELFIFDDSGETYVMQGGSLVRSWNRPQSGTSQPAAVAGDIRVLGRGQGEQGSQTDLFGNDLGGRYTQQVSGTTFDGTTDGRNFNYSIETGTGTVYRFDRNWQSPQSIFTLGSGTWSITYDGSNDSLWLLNAAASQMYNYTTGGGQITQFGVDLQGQGDSLGLALDPADGLLYFGDEDNFVPWRIYDRSGNFRGTLDMIGRFAGTNIHGAEFNIPAPGAGALLAAGALAAARRRRA